MTSFPQHPAGTPARIPEQAAGSPEQAAGSPTEEDPHRGPTEWRGVTPPAGVGPLPQPWPTDPRLDPQLMADGDHRNVVDRYRYWRHEAIVADLDTRRHPFQVAIENLTHDMNIGTIVRTANAFMAQTVHIVGHKRWNKRGAMVTDRYQHLQHHDSTDALLEHAAAAGLPVIAVDNLPGSVPIETADFPRECLLAFGSERGGITDTLRQGSTMTVSIAQFGSTRSINVAVAAGIAMHTWVRQHTR